MFEGNKIVLVDSQVTWDASVVRELQGLEYEVLRLAEIVTPDATGWEKAIAVRNMIVGREKAIFDPAISPGIDLLIASQSPDFIFALNSLLENDLAHVRHRGGSSLKMLHQLITAPEKLGW
jgi:hypothetical protein